MVLWGYFDVKKLILMNSRSYCLTLNFHNIKRMVQMNTEKILNLTFGYFRKMYSIKQKSKTILDIGPGCSNLASKLINNSRELNHNLILIDSSEMLDQLEDSSGIRKIAARFPDCKNFLEDFKNKIDVIVCYSVFHYVFHEGNIFNFLDSALSLLSPGGQMLIGDIPNISKEKIFLNTIRN